MGRVTHGQTRGYTETLTYRSWRGMFVRCEDPKTHNYSRYGGRGIKVCERWIDYANFVADMGERPSADHSIDRIDNDGDYRPDNCRWATRLEQRRNQERSRIRPEDVPVIRALVAAGRRGIKQTVAAMYDVSSSRITKILKEGR